MSAHSAKQRNAGIRISYLDRQSSLIGAPVRSPDEERKVPSVLSRRDANPLMQQNPLYSGGDALSYLLHQFEIAILAGASQFRSTSVLYHGRHRRPDSAKVLSKAKQRDITERRAAAVNEARVRHGGLNHASQHKEASVVRKLRTIVTESGQLEESAPEEEAPVEKEAAAEEPAPLETAQPEQAEEEPAPKKSPSPTRKEISMEELAEIERIRQEREAEAMRRQIEIREKEKAQIFHRPHNEP